MPTNTRATTKSKFYWPKILNLNFLEILWIL
jgi:hypothetical protein